MLEASLVTLGAPSQLTGGYLYHRRMADAAPSHGVEVRFASLPAGRFPLPALGGWAALREITGARVILVDSIVAAFLAPALRHRPPPVPLIAVVHQPMGGIDHGRLQTWLQASLDRSLYRRTHCVIAASHALADELAAGGLDRDSIEVVPPGCDGGAPESPPPDLRLGRSASLLCVGNWVERKGILDLVQAFTRLSPEAATLHLVGRVDVEPRYARAIRTRLEAPDLAGRVVVHGPVPRDKVTTLLAAADVFVLPSVREPYGTVYGEALAMGVPAVGWRAGNLPHLVEDGKEGILLPVGDVAGLADALARLASDPALRARLSTAAKERGRQLATWDQSAARFFAIVRRVADAGAGGAR